MIRILFKIQTFLSTLVCFSLSAKWNNGNIGIFLKDHPVRTDLRSCVANSSNEGVWRVRIPREGMKAGINDRMSIMTQLLNLALATCTKLMFPIPCRSLSAAHSTRQPYNSVISCDHSWDHYVRISHPWLLLESNSSTVPIDDPKHDYFDIYNFYNWKAGRKEISKLPEVVVVNTTSRQDAYADSIITQYTKGAKFYALHVRRTDVKHLCDTSIPKVVCNMRAILGNTTLGGRMLRHNLFFMTDEKNSSYHTELIRELKLIPELLDVMNLDQLVELSLMNESKMDNYYAFQIAKSVRSKSEIFVEMTHQGRCPKTYFAGSQRFY